MIDVKQVFYSLSGNSGLIEEFIYNNIDKKRTQYKILSGSTSDETNMGMIPKCKKRNGDEIKVFEDKQGILVVRKGKAGKMIYLTPGKYTINDDAYILYLKEQFKHKYNINTKEDEELFLKYFIYRYQFEMYTYSTKTSNASWSKTAFFDFCSIEIESKELMKKIVDRYEDCLKERDKINKVKNMLENLSEKVLSVDKNYSNLEQIDINKILAYKSRNDALSEEGIYNRSPNQNTNRIINVLSGSTKELFYGKIDADSPKIHILENQGLHVITRGKAGKLTYIPKGTYATNTNAFLFYIKPEAYKLVNVNSEYEEMFYLKFLRIYLQPIFFESSSKSDLGVFPLTELMNTLKIPCFEYNEEMVKIVERYEKFEKYLSAVEEAENKIEMLLDKQIAID